ncbi:hypothetical protein F5Y10DRAFT_260879 [Nemania abortiva]|nr:hypothetical protein F5Y10DRAFT_260879 [Nemania abortiva]
MQRVKEARAAPRLSGPPPPDNDSTENEDLYKLFRAAAPELLIRDKENNTILNVATVQRLMLFHLQATIIEKVGPLVLRQLAGGNPLEDPGLKKALEDYVQGIRDWELMVEYEAKVGDDKTKDPFHFSSKWSLTREAMTKAGIQGGASGYFSSGLQANIGSFEQRNQINRARTFRESSLRYSVAISGGLALVGPMWLMVLHKDKYTYLITTTVAVLLFASIVPRYSTAGPEVVVATVAAYAAVLVVFVGTLVA